MNKFMYILAICLAFLTSSCLASYPYGVDTSVSFAPPVSYPLYYPYNYGYNSYYGNGYYHHYPVAPRPIIVNPRPVIVPRPNMGGFNNMNHGYGHGRR